MCILRKTQMLVMISHEISFVKLTVSILDKLLTNKFSLLTLEKYMISLIASIMVDGQRISGESLTIYIVNIQKFLYMLLELASVPIFWYILLALFIFPI